MRDYDKALANLKKLSSMADNMTVTTEPSEKIGSVWEVTKIGDKELYRKLVEIEPTEEEAEAEPSGDYLDPIHYEVGSEVVEGKFYYADDYDLRWQAKQSGVPTDFADTEYFDIVE